MTEQIYYNMWGTESDEHKDYFYTIGTIANWIGYALIGPRHKPYTTEIMPLSNIAVLQTKEKFGSPRVYVSFSEETHLQDARHYRHVYKTAIKLFPQYEKAIRDGMDYTTYMFDTEEELTKYTITQIEWAERVRDAGEVGGDWFEERMQMIRETESFLKKVCLFT
tara:strand:+ start:9890 stop:10384 length:495 start_codon:yes stop_codon:yes gene_type:complete